MSERTNKWYRCVFIHAKYQMRRVKWSGRNTERKTATKKTSQPHYSTVCMRRLSKNLQLLRRSQNSYAFKLNLSNYNFILNITTNAAAVAAMINAIHTKWFLSSDSMLLWQLLLLFHETTRKIAATSTQSNRKFVHTHKTKSTCLFRWSCKQFETIHWIPICSLL